MTEYELVGGQRLTNVHAPDQCFGEWCCIHNPSPHHMVYWPQNWRADRRIMERVCPHGIGHPDPDDPKTSDYYEGIHGCDGCCFDPDDDESTVEFQLDPSTDSLLSDSDNVVTPDDSDIIVSNTIASDSIPSDSKVSISISRSLARELATDWTPLDEHDTLIELFDACRDALKDDQ